MYTVRPVYTAVYVGRPVNTARVHGLCFEMPLGLWTRVGRRKHVLHGGALAQPGGYNGTIRVRRRCGLMSNYFDYLLLLLLLLMMLFPHHCTDPDVSWRNGRGAL